MNQNLIIVTIVALLIWPFALAALVLGPGELAVRVGMMGVGAELIIAISIATALPGR